MKKNKGYIYLFCMLTANLFYACEENSPIDNEQYIKQIYIVGADKVVRAIDVKYGDSQNPQSDTYIAIGTGGSLNVDKDVNVTLASNDQTIDWYNKKYMLDSPVRYQKLNGEFYNIPSWSTVIKAGDVYGRFPITINTSSLNCDSLYALTFKIASVSDYQKRDQDTVLVMNINMVNDYSGTYQMTATKYILDANGNETAPTSINVTRTLKAVDKGTIRFFNETVNEATSAYQTRDAYFNAINNNCVVFTRESNGQFTAKGWKNLGVVSEKVQYSENQFQFSYSYVSGSTTFRLKGKLVK